MEHKREYDEHFKVILLGDNAVGKSSLMHTYCGGTLYPFDEYMSTIGVDQKIQSINAFNKKIQLRIWDASGAPRLQKVVDSYFRTVDGALVCFDLSQKGSLQNTKAYIERLRATKKNVPILLVGCKADITHRREIPTEQAQQLADELGIDYLEVSALKKANIEQPFTHILEQIYISKQLNKVKPTLEAYFHEYLKLTNPRNLAGFFIEQGLLLSKGDEKLQEEFKTHFKQLYDFKNVEELVAFCRKASELMERGSEFYKRDNPVLSGFVSSPLTKIVKQTLNVLTNVLGEMLGLAAAKELISQKSTMANVL
ncbi:Rab family GTPase [Legionella cherrii]|uniref:Ras family GTPase n=1 Tax=Legionella cherrii TaxID=28084 RepID=A0A0W0SD97_9GAMM|nr:Rab family GTPase [Legionella cherrii]KTC81037.1 Ras family GTPase [Legionella cherrii]VEB33792.1 Ras family GTPase [Legionella cherrii]